MTTYWVIERLKERAKADGVEQTRQRLQENLASAIDFDNTDSYREMTWAAARLQLFNSMYPSVKP